MFASPNWYFGQFDELCFSLIWLIMTLKESSFLNWSFSSPNMVRTVRRTILRSVIWLSNDSEMQASVRTCGRSAADSMISPKCRLKPSEIKSIYFNYPSQGNSANYYIILDLGDKAASPTSQHWNKNPPPPPPPPPVSEVPSNTVIHFPFFLIRPQESFLLSAN